jgi:hypothetical protein
MKLTTWVLFDKPLIRMGDESILGSQIQFFWENFKLGYEIQLPMPTPPQLLFD